MMYWVDILALGLFSTWLSFLMRPSGMKIVLACLLGLLALCGAFTFESYRLQGQWGILIAIGMYSGSLYFKHRSQLGVRMGFYTALSMMGTSALFACVLYLWVFPGWRADISALDADNISYARELIDASYYNLCGVAHAVWVSGCVIAFCFHQRRTRRRKQAMGLPAKADTTPLE